MSIFDLLLGDASQERTVTIKTKPTKKEQAPEMPIDGGSANLPQGVLDLLHSGNRAQMKAEQDRNSQLMQLLGLQSPMQPMEPFSLAEFQSSNRAQASGEDAAKAQIMQLMGLGGGAQIPMGMEPTAPVFDPMAGQRPMDFSVAGGFNPYGG